MLVFMANLSVGGVSWPNSAMWGSYEMCARRRFVIVIAYYHTCLFGFWLSASSPGDVVGVRLRMLDHMTGLWSSQLLALQLRDCNQYMETSSPSFFNRIRSWKNCHTSEYSRLYSCQQFLSHGLLLP